MMTTFPAHARPDVNNLMSAMEELEHSTGISLHAAIAAALFGNRCHFREHHR